MDQPASPPSDPRSLILELRGLGCDRVPYWRAVGTVAGVGIALGWLAVGALWWLQDNADRLARKSEDGSGFENTADWIDLLTKTELACIGLGVAMVGSWLAAGFVVIYNDRKARAKFTALADRAETAIGAAVADGKRGTDFGRKMYGLSVVADERNGELERRLVEAYSEMRDILRAHNKIVTGDDHLRIYPEKEEADIWYRRVRIDARQLILDGETIRHELIPTYIGDQKNEEWIRKAIYFVGAQFTIEEAQRFEAEVDINGRETWVERRLRALSAFKAFIARMDASRGELGRKER